MRRPPEPRDGEAGGALRVPIAALEAAAPSRRRGYLRACHAAAERVTEHHVYLDRSAYERLRRRYRPLLPPPGDALAWGIRRLTGRSASGCGRCGRRRRRMNAWGWGGCLRRLPTIVAWLRAEAGAPRWLHPLPRPGGVLGPVVDLASDRGEPSRVRRLSRRRQMDRWGWGGCLRRWRVIAGWWRGERRARRGVRLAR